MMWFRRKQRDAARPEPNRPPVLGRIGSVVSTDFMVRGEWVVADVSWSDDGFEQRMHVVLVDRESWERRHWRPS